MIHERIKKYKKGKGTVEDDDDCVGRQRTSKTGDSIEAALSLLEIDLK